MPKFNRNRRDERFSKAEDFQGNPEITHLRFIQPQHRYCSLTLESGGKGKPLSEVGDTYLILHGKS